MTVPPKPLRFRFYHPPERHQKVSSSKAPTTTASQTPLKEHRQSVKAPFGDAQAHSGAPLTHAKAQAQRTVGATAASASPIGASTPEDLKTRGKVAPAVSADGASQRASGASESASRVAAPSTQPSRLRARGKGWKTTFLDYLSRCPNITAAARIVGISRDCVYHERNKNPQFALAMDAKIREAVDLLELEAWRRAMQGTKKPVWMRDERNRPVQVGELVEHSDRLMEILLRGHMPQKYGKQAMEVTGPNGQPLALPAPIGQVIITLPDNGRGTSPPAAQQMVQVDAVVTPELTAPASQPTAQPQPAPPQTEPAPAASASQQPEPEEQPEAKLDPRLDPASRHYVPLCFRSRETMSGPPPVDEPAPKAERFRAPFRNDPLRGGTL